jgi:hypothetical protein
MTLVIARRNARSMSVSLGRSSVMVAITASLNKVWPANVADELATRQRCLNVPPVPASGPVRTLDGPTERRRRDALANPRAREIHDAMVPTKPPRL